MGSAPGRTQHEMGFCTVQDPKLIWVLHLARPNVIMGPALHPIRFGPAS